MRGRSTIKAKAEPVPVGSELRLREALVQQLKNRTPEAWAYAATGLNA